MSQTLHWAFHDLPRRFGTPRLCVLLLLGSIPCLLVACYWSAGLSEVSAIVPRGVAGRSLSNQPAHVPLQPAPAAMSLPDDITLDGEERRFIELFQEGNPSVVNIHVDREPLDSAIPAFRQQILRAHDSAGFRGRFSDPNAGSGFVFDDDGLILTTNRVVSGGREIQVTFADGTETLAMLIGADPNTDLAVLKVSRLPAAAGALLFRDSDSLQVGQRVVALGNPLGHGGVMTAGVVSAKARNVSLEISINDGGRRGFFTAPDLIQTDAVILPGSVGGPLIDLDGEVVGVLGIDTNLFDAAERTRAGGVGFSIPTSTVRRVVPVLVEQGRYPYPWLGISAMDMDPDLAQVMDLPYDQRGVLVARVTPGSPAERAGLRAGDMELPMLGRNVLIGGDVIVGFQGKPVRDFGELVSLLFRRGTVGEIVALTIKRDGDEITLPVTLEERP